MVGVHRAAGNREEVSRNYVQATGDAAVGSPGALLKRSDGRSVAHQRYAEAVDADDYLRTSLPQRISAGSLARFAKSESILWESSGVLPRVHALIGEGMPQSRQRVSANLVAQFGQVACLAKVSKACPH